MRANTAVKVPQDSFKSFYHLQRTNPYIWSQKNARFWVWQQETLALLGDKNCMTFFGVRGTLLGEIFGRKTLLVHLKQAWCFWVPETQDEVWGEVEQISFMANHNQYFKNKVSLTLDVWETGTASQRTELPFSPQQCLQVLILHPEN